MSRLLGAVLVMILAATASGAESRLPASAAEVKLSFAPVVRQTKPAVVNIYAKRMVASRGSPFAGDPFFEQFFRHLDVPTARVQNSLGSGVIVDPAGVVVTNYHVVGEATDIRVVLTDRREYVGEIMLADEGLDLAVIRLKGASGLPALEFADSRKAEVGDLVLAIGDPFGVGQTVTSGIVSALGRGSMRGSEGGYMIQADAPINPGNSGGALVDMDGRLLGINSSIVSRSGGSNGIGFAIPSALVRAMVDQAKSGATTVWRPWLGLDAQPVDADLAEALSLDLPQGLLVAGMHELSPLAKAGLQPGDVILEVDGEPLYSTAELEFELMIRGEGAKVPLTLVRGGKRVEMVMEVQMSDVNTPGPTLVLGRSSIFAGTEVAALTPYWIAKFDLPADARGVVVTADDGRAARGGLTPGDLLTAVNGTEVMTPEDLDRLTDLNAANTWLVDLWRQGREMRIRIRR